MATQIKKSKPTSPGRRFRSWVSRDDLHKEGPYAPLLEPKKQKSGRKSFYLSRNHTCFSIESSFVVLHYLILV